MNSDSNDGARGRYDVTTCTYILKSVSNTCPVALSKI